MQESSLKNLLTPQNVNVLVTSFPTTTIFTPLSLLVTSFLTTTFTPLSPSPFHHWPMGLFQEQVDSFQLEVIADHNQLSVQ